ncbi:MAG: hypothetical protein H8D56_05430 [Planctomycetes bacterium]|nr:hypothetical protein [Planctomycetota bacterium]
MVSCKVKDVLPGNRHQYGDPKKMTYRDRTDMGGVRETFLTTHWSLIDGVKGHTMQDESFDQDSSVEISMDETVYIGLAITSSSSTRSAQARLSNVDITGSVTPDGLFTMLDDISLLILSDPKD